MLEFSITNFPAFFLQLLDMLKVYAEFEIDERTGEALTIHNRIDLHYDRVLALQVGTI